MPGLRRGWFGWALVAFFPSIVSAEDVPPGPRDGVPPGTAPAGTVPVHPGSDAAPANPAPPPPAEAPTRTDPRTSDIEQANPTVRIEPRIRELEQRLRAVEDKRALERHEADRIAADKSRNVGLAVAYSQEGVGIVSSDGKFQFRFRPILQVDARFFVQGGTNTFLLRRVRPAIEGTLFEYFDWRFMPELAGTPNVQDAFVNVRPLKELQLRAGKFVPPVGLERLAIDSDVVLPERGLPTNLVPDRDIGIQLHGEILGGTLTYAAGVFNGAGDGVNGDNDDNDKKDIAGRIFVRPFQPLFIAPLRKLGMGVAATNGVHVGALPPFRTPDGTAFFRFEEGVAAGGTHRRIAPQANYYVGPLGLFAEYTQSTQIVVAPGTSFRLSHDAWQVVGSFFLTGEDASYTPVTPKHALDPRTFGTGAIELVARYGELRVDNDAFRGGFALADKSARKATEWGVGINWHMARNVKLMVNYGHTRFEGGASGGGDRPAEMLILSRLQAAY